MMDFYDNSESDMKIWRLPCGGRIIADTSNGTIVIKPWSSDIDKDDGAGEDRESYAGMANDRIVLTPETPRVLTILQYLSQMMEHYTEGGGKVETPIGFEEPEPPAPPRAAPAKTRKQNAEQRTLIANGQSGTDETLAAWVSK